MQFVVMLTVRLGPGTSDLCHSLLPDCYVILVVVAKLLLTGIFLQHTCLNNIWRHQGWIVN